MGTKKKYLAPHIERIPLDNEISLALQSTPPLGPGEDFGYNSNNPYKADSVTIV